MATFISNSAVDTEEAGRRFASKVEKGAVLALKGDLGSGKTHFTKGFVKGVGSEKRVTSPTFTILHEYDGGRFPIYHFDFFRLEDPESVLRLGLDEYLFGQGVSVIEWADRFPDLIPEHACWISFEIKAQETRAIHFS